MRFLPLVRLASSRLAIPRLGGVRITGQSTANAVLVYVGAFDAFVPGDPSLSVHVSGVYGDGIDGDVHYTSDTTLTSDIRATRIVVDEGVTVQQNGFIQTASVSILNNGIIHDNGTSSDQSTDCTAGIAAGNPSGSGPQGLPTSNQQGTLFTFEPFGAKGGDGGGVGHSLGGDNSVDWTLIPNLISPFATNHPTDIQRVDFATQIQITLTVGCGGGAGGDTGAGNGGHGARLVRLRAPQIINNGTISARGENGQDGDADANPNANGGGGGGGGRIIIYGKLLVAGTLDASGGLGGVAAGTGTDGQPGEDGTIHLFG